MQNRLIKRALIFVLFVYATVITGLCLKLKPETVIIAVEDSGTRVVTNENDAALKKERENFLKKFVSLIYMYDATTFRPRISQAGDLMEKKLWQKHEDEFLKLSERLSTDELTQKVKILDLREIDPESYQADLEISVVRKLEEKKGRVTVELKVQKSKRQLLNPYDMEVTDYVERPLL